jgi:SM-20-related protein
VNALETPLVIDGMFNADHLERLAKLFDETGWKFGWGSNTIGESVRHWNKHFAGGGKTSRTPCDLELLENENAKPISDTWIQIRDKLLPGHSLVRCYANAHTFGLDGSIHRDNPKEVNAVTTILYCHRLWPLPWGGETVFYDVDTMNIKAAVFPNPGRLALFSGSVPHAARSPGRVCRELRISLVFKSMSSEDLQAA